MATRRTRLRIHGKVQGVFFRESARAEAEARELAGWIRNNPDGTVEALVEGPHAAVDGFTDWCRHGPPSAQVAQLEATHEPARGDLGPFIVERSP